MLNILSDNQINKLIKEIDELPRYKMILKGLIAIRPRNTDSDYSIKAIEDWDAKIRNCLNVIMNVEYLERYWYDDIFF
ncbi:hypothetical protein ES702_01454 [subsurface metagenome]